MIFLLTGFEPFGSSDINPSEQVARALDGWVVGDYTVSSAILPVDAERGPRCLLQAIRERKPAAVLCLGEAGSQAVVAVERLAVNLLDFRISDNSGNQITDQSVAADGPAAYFSTLPVRAMVEAIRAAGIPAELSMSAGTFLCNQVMYTLLDFAARENRSLPGGFIHLPSLPQQAAKAARPGPSMALETSVAAVRAALSAAVDLL